MNLIFIGGGAILPPGLPAVLVEVIEIDITGLTNLAHPTSVLAMKEPHICDRFQQGKPTPACRGVYDEAEDGGFAGLCPGCANHTTTA